MAKTASKTRKKPALKEEAPQPLPQARIPIYGEHVRRPGSDTEYEITWVSPNNLRVHIGIPRTNFEHRNVDATLLTYLDEPIATAKPTKAVVNAPEVMEHVAVVQHGVLDHLAGEPAILKKYLKAKHVPADAGDELDTLCKEHEEALTRRPLRTCDMADREGACLCALGILSLRVAESDHPARATLHKASYVQRKGHVSETCFSR